MPCLEVSIDDHLQDDDDAKERDETSGVEVPGEPKDGGQNTREGHSSTESMNGGSDGAWPSTSRLRFSDPLPMPDNPCPQVRQCTWEEFKNRFPGEQPCAVEVLRGGSDLNGQVLDDSSFYLNLRDEGRMVDRISGGSWDNTKRERIQRVRIQSRAVMRVLSAVSGDSWDSDRTHTFLRPFGYLIHHQNRVKAELQRLVVESTGKLGSGKPPENDGCIADSDSLAATESAIQEIRCYAGFVDEFLMPLFRQFEGSDLGQSPIPFDDLWYLFRPGELVYLPPHPDIKHQTAYGKNALSLSGQQSVWRVCSIHPHYKVVRDELVFVDLAGPPMVPSAVEDRRARETERQAPPRTPPGSCVLFCYYLDYNGESIIPVWKRVVISPFRGERQIRSLAAYPIRFLERSQEVLRQCRAQGENFLKCIQLKRMFCDGWTMMIEPDGSPVLDDSGHPDEILELFQGEVIIDVKEACQDNPQWRFCNPECKPYDPKTLVNLETCRVVDWPDQKRSRVSAQHLELVVLNDDVQRFEYNEYLQTDPHLGGSWAPDDKQRLTQDDLALLPRRLYVFSLSKRLFGVVDISDLRPIVSHTDALDKLQIDKDKKSRIESLISYHFMQKAARSVNRDIATQDFLKSGRCGLVILIQGAPGVGKTATAEAVAQAYQKPLFSIHIEDLDWKARKLGIFFRWAELWDCVVLLDEIDVFLSQRDKNAGLDSNMLVSVLLRVLDDFSGILFLTTNRPGVLDEALKSRVHLNLCYEKLSLKHTLGIFKLNIDGLKESQKQQQEATGQTPLFIFEKDILEFAERHYVEHERYDGLGRWNGRQIRNAFHTASALAYYAVHDKPGAQPQLRASDFEEVQNLVVAYDRARANILSNKSDAQVALERSERCDTAVQYEQHDLEVPALHQHTQLPFHPTSQAPEDSRTAAPSAVLGMPQLLATDTSISGEKESQSERITISRQREEAPRKSAYHRDGEGIR